MFVALIVVVCPTTSLFSASKREPYSAFMAALLAEKSGALQTAKENLEFVVSIDSTAQLPQEHLEAINSWLAIEQKNTLNLQAGNATISNENVNDLPQTQSEPLSYMKRYLEALSLFENKEYRKSEKILKELVDVYAISAQSNFILGVLYDRTNRSALAEKFIERSVEINPYYSTALNYLAYRYAEQNKNISKAMDFANRAISVEEQNPAFFDTLGWVYFRMSEYSAALELIDLASQELEDPVVFEHLGDVKTQLGNLQGAWVAYTHSLLLAPDNKNVRKKLSSVSSKLPSDVYALKVIETTKEISGKINSVKAFFTFTGDYQNKNLRINGKLLYKSPQKIKVELISGPFADSPVVIKNGQSLKTNFSSAENSFELENVTEFLEKYFSGSLLSDNSSDAIYSRKGKELSVLSKTQKKIINTDNFSLLEYSELSDDVFLKFANHSPKYSSYLPEFNFAFPIRIYLIMKKRELSGQINFKNIKLNEPIDDSEFEQR